MIQQYVDQASAAIMQYVPRVAGALVVLVVGWIAIKIIVGVMKRRLQKSSADPSLHGFLTGLLGAGLKIMLIISVIGMLGVQMTSFIAVLGAAGLAVGLALQGSLSNFAGGVLILVSKPFKVGEVVDAQGHKGTVKEISILYTNIDTFTGEVVVIPNGDLANSDIVNYSRKPIRRLDLTVGISYDSDIKKAKERIESLVSADERVLKDPKHSVDVGNLGDSSVDIRVTMWTKNANFLQLKLDLTEQIKLDFDENKISFPFPSMEVYMKK